jgi:putative sterol carrier protein
MNVFPSSEWVAALDHKLNNDAAYAAAAEKWEGDICFVIEADEALPERVVIFLDLWHGACRMASMLPAGEACEAAFTLTAPFSNWVRILQNDLHPMQAMLTQKLKVKGNMGYLMRHVPTVLDFTRCAVEITEGVAGAQGAA